MEIKIVKKAAEINANEWNALISKKDIFHQHNFIQGIEKSKVEDAKMEYLLFYADNKLVGSALLSVFKINLDLFINENGLVRAIKKLSSGFFKVKILFCGTPLSAGHHNLFVSDKTHLPQITQLLCLHINKRCENENIKFSVYKEFCQEYAKDLNPFLTTNKYFQACSLPTVILDTNYQNYDDYLHSLRATYRRQILQSAKKIKAKYPIFIANYFAGSMNEKSPVFTLIRAEDFDAKSFYKLYCKVMSRATVKLEILNETFFIKFCTALKKELKILAMVFEGKTLGVFITTQVDDVLTFIWTGKELEKDKYDTYFNLMNAMVFYAIRKKCTQIVLGQTCYYTKQRFGGKIKDLFIFFKAHSWWKNNLLRGLNKIIFPKTKVNKLHVFR